MISIGKEANNSFKHNGILGMINDLENDKIHTKENEKEIKYLKAML